MSGCFLTCCILGEILSQLSSVNFRYFRLLSSLPATRGTFHRCLFHVPVFLFARRCSSSVLMVYCTSFRSPSFCCSFVSAVFSVPVLRNVASACSFRAVAPAFVAPKFVAPVVLLQGCCTKHVAPNVLLRSLLHLYFSLVVLHCSCSDASAFAVRRVSFGGGVSNSAHPFLQASISA